MRRQTKLELIEQMVDQEASPSEVLRLSRMTIKQLRAEIVRQRRAYKASCRRAARKWCSRCHRRGCRNLMHSVTQLSPFTSILAPALKTKAKGITHEWVVDQMPK